MSQQYQKLAVIIPCFNEAASIATVIKKFPLSQIAAAHLTLDIYVIDNNSTDDTAHIAKAAGATVIQEPKKGKGHALRAGFAALPSDTDFVAMLDGDDTYSPEEILRVIEPLQSNFCDAVVGSRLGGTIQAGAMRPFNRLGNWAFTNAVRTGYQANVSDVLTGYFAWKKDALDELYPHLTSQGFAIEMEMITKMARLEHRLASVPISYHPRSGESHLRPLRDGMRIAAMFFKNLAWNPPKTFHPKTKKVVFVSDSVYPYMVGGKEKRLHEISKRLAAMGYDVHIYTMHWWKGPEKIRVENGVTLHALCRHYTMYNGERRSVLEAVLFGLSCLKLIRVKFDILDVDHMPFFPILGTWIICKLRHRTFFGTWHEALSPQDWDKYMGKSGRIASFIEHISIRLPHTITAASTQTKELLGSIHGRVERVGLVASGIDTVALQQVPRADITCDILYAGRLVKDKNISTLISAVKILAKKQPFIQCLIIGKGVEKARLEKQVAKLNLESNVSFLNPFDDATELYAHMKAAKVFCSVSEREGFGIISLEALGCGTPVITTNCLANAARHLIQDGQNGSVVAPTATAVATAISKWISLQEKPDLSVQIADHTWDTLAQRQAEVYML